MTADELRKNFLEFFQSKNHKIVPSASLIPENDPSVLFTTAGMQQFKRYYVGEKSPYGPNVCSCQKCFRTSDIEEVGDESHLTFFEMLGNFSFGWPKEGYFKKEAIGYAYEFITRVLKLKIDYVTVFKGDIFEELPPDKDSENFWQEIDPNLKIVKSGKEDNFWGPTGSEGPCGPTTEIYINGIEIWNLVFNEYYRNSDGALKKLESSGVDTGMGLERLAMVSQNKKNVFETDLFKGILVDSKEKRIIADHIKAAVFLISDGVLPSNVERGYVLRRLIRRAMRYGEIEGVAEKFIDIYKDVYPNIEKNKEIIIEEIKKEKEKFSKTLERGIKNLKSQIIDLKSKNLNIISGDIVFDLYQTYGFPLELTSEMAKEEGMDVDVSGFKKKYQEHQDISRTASAGMFKGGLIDHSEKSIKYHTASHLLLESLRRVLGKHVEQRGSNITPERLRFDFSHPQKMTPEEIKKVEDMVNEKIKEDLEVKFEDMKLEEAKRIGATGVFESKYGEIVRVYTIGPKGNGESFSREICGGPHVENTGCLGHFKIIKEESSSSGIRRIKAILE